MKNTSNVKTRDIEYYDFVNKVIDDAFNEIDYCRIKTDFYERLTRPEWIVTEIGGCILAASCDRQSEEETFDEIQKLFEKIVETWRAEPLNEEFELLLKKLNEIPVRWKEQHAGESRTEFKEFNLAKLSQSKLSLDNDVLVNMKKSNRKAALSIMRSVFVSSWWIPLLLSSRKACSTLVGGVVLGGLIGTMVFGKETMKEKSEKIFMTMIAPRIKARFSEPDIVKVFEKTGETLVREKYVLPLMNAAKEYFSGQQNEAVAF